ncbi:MAG: hypothetical protein GC138_02820 [Gammaproteobacteria bacterium]|nr:hypothetical protein [Gammaproteobacteria bacterium]
MKRFYCLCGGEVFLENNLCTRCGRELGYAPDRGEMVSLEPVDDHLWRVATADPADGRTVRLCTNRQQHGVCNAVIEDEDPHTFCLACRLNRTIPDLSKPENLLRWQRLEAAKRRLIFSLLSLGLPLEAPVGGYPRGLCFDFLEDKRSNHLVEEEFVTTGHLGGVITINVLEADDIQRVWQRELSSERYRTLLGHLRHESGHYYFELLAQQDNEGFAALFGDPALSYGEALRAYYENGAAAGWEQNHISAYASSHPLEDWAECFAHYLHMTDTLETAVERQVIPPLRDDNDIDDMLKIWDGLSVTINELNRGLGLRDAYPFVVTPTVADKLRFVHRAIRDR